MALDIDRLARKWRGMKFVQSPNECEEGYRGVWIDETEEVQWSITHKPNGRILVYGYTIRKKSGSTDTDSDNLAGAGTEKGRDPALSE